MSLSRWLSKEEHLAKADHNANFAQSLVLTSQVNIDWAFTALFYSGLHYVEAYLTSTTFDPKSHDTHGRRARWFVTDATLRSLNREYSDLSYFSRRARYYCLKTNASEVTEEALPALKKIQTQIRAVL